MISAASLRGKMEKRRKKMHRWDNIDNLPAFMGHVALTMLDGAWRPA